MRMTIPADAREAAFLAQPSDQSQVRSSGSLLGSLPIPVRREIERLTELVFFPRSAPDRQSIVLVDMDSTGRSSSLWLATYMASMLGSALRRTVYILSVSPANALPRSNSNADPKLGQVTLSNRFLIEHIGENRSRGDGMGALTDRLAKLRSEGYPVIVHIPYQEQASLFACADTIEGVVLLVRASRTHRAALQAVERRLAATNVPLLGSVLLDRVYPIPEKLYRVL